MDLDSLQTAGVIAGLAKSAVETIGSLKDQFKGDKKAEKKLDAALSALRELNSVAFAFQEKSFRLLQELGELQAKYEQLRKDIGREEERTAERKKYRIQQVGDGTVLIRDDQPGVYYCATCGDDGHYIPLQVSSFSEFGGFPSHKCGRCRTPVKLRG